MKNSFNEKLELSKYKKLLPYIVLAVLLTLSTLAWQYYEKAALEREERRYGEYVDVVVNDITKRLDKYKMILRGGAGVFAASEEVTRDEWLAYYEYQQVSTLYPGIEAISFSRVIRLPELAQHLEEIRAEGFPDYTVWPAGEREVYAPVVFMEPFDEQNRRAFGYDLFSEPVCRAALERARDAGCVAISCRVMPGTDTGQENRSTFLMVAPVYAQGMSLSTSEERRAAIEGYVLGAFIMQDLMQGIFTDPIHKIDFYIYDGAQVSPETLLYDNHVSAGVPDEERRPLFTGQKTLDLYGHQWTLVFETTPVFEAAVDQYTAKGILTAGLLISLLVFFYLRTLETTSDRALVLAREMTSALRESEQQLKKITDNISDVVATCNMEGEITYLSPQSQKILSYEPEDLIGKTIFHTVFNDDLPEVMQKFNDSLKTGTSDKAEYRIMTKDGSLIWAETSGDLLYEDGQVSGAVFVTRDITERKQLEEQISESKQMYQSVVDTQQEMICRYLPDSTLTFVNDAYCRSFGKTRQELLGRKYLEFLPPEVHEMEMELLTSLTPAKPSLTQEYRVLLPDGNTRWQEWSDYALFSEAGELKEIQGVGRDITERKQSEEEIRRQAKRTQALLQIASHLNADLELKTVLHTVCEEVCAALHVPLSAFLLYDSKSRAFQLTAFLGLPPESARAMQPLPRAAYDQMIQRLGKASVIPDLVSVPDLPYAELLREHGIKSCVYAVMEREVSPTGFLVAAATGEKFVFPEDAAHLLAGLADQAASALVNARLYAEVQERLRQVQALRNIDMAITGSLDLRVTFQIVLDEVTRMLTTDAAAILRLDPHTGTLKYEHWRGFLTKDLRSFKLPLGEGYGGRIALERQPIHIPDLREIKPDPVQGPLIANEGFVAYYAMPLIAKGSVRGVLEVFHREPLDSNGDWLAFLETLAGQAAIAIDNAELFARLEYSNVALLRAYDATIEGWAYALDLKDEETEGHSRRVTDMTVNVAREMDIKEEALAHVRRGALLHDIGKMGIPDAILLKPGKLTGEEWELMRKHPVYAFEMLSSIDYLRPALEIPYCHHEKWDGSGYPRGLKGEQIPLAARIFAVVDVFDALTSDRPYRKAWSEQKTLVHIQQGSGKHFDPQVVEVFLKVIANTTER